MFEATAGGEVSLAGRTVLVTGSDGFIGSHVVERVLAAGARVRAFCLYTATAASAGSTSHRSSPAPSPTVAPRWCSATSATPSTSRRRSRASTSCCTSRRSSRSRSPTSRPAPTSRRTSIGTLNVLEGVRRHGTPAWSTPRPRRSTAPPSTSRSPRRTRCAASRRTPRRRSRADKMCESYALSFGTPVTTLRPFNTFGPRQSARAVIPTVLSQLLAGADELRLGRRHAEARLHLRHRHRRRLRPRPRWPTSSRARPSSSAPAAPSRSARSSSCAAASPARARAIVTDEERIRPEGSEVQVLLSDPARRGGRARLGAHRVARGRPAPRRPSGCARGSTPTTAGRYHR